MSQPAAHPAPGAVRKATTFHLVFMTYAVICSGAYGLEEMVSSSGPGMALLVLTALPFIWAVPLALTCSELSAHHPVEGGYYRWARLAFGDFTGYMAGWLVWLANLATNGTFAVLFANYLGYWVPLSSWMHWGVATVLVAVATWLNVRGIRIVGSASVVATLLIFLPFCGLTLLGLLKWRFNPMVPFTPPGVGLFPALMAGLPIAIWLYSGFEKLTPNAGEVEHPSRAFPIALAFAVPMTAGTYILPTFAALAAAGDWHAWGESHYAVVSRLIGGPVLGTMMAAGGLVSNFCILMVTMLGQSRLPMVMAEDGLFPAVFGRTHPRYGTPIVALAVGAVALVALCRLKFSYLAGLFAFVQVFAYLLIYLSLFRLRARRRPAAVTDGAKPFTIPLGRVGLALMTAPSFALSALLVVQTVWHDGAFDARQAWIDAAVFASGPATFFLFRRRRPSSAVAIAGPTETA